MIPKKTILIFPTNEHWKKAIVHANIETSLHEDMHAGEIETSILLHLNQGLVRENKMVDELASNRSFLHLLGMKGYTQSGVIGLPTLANKAKGKLLLESLSKSAIEDINSFCFKS
ncbi:creatininase family protein [Acaryochloris sp. 'Moss Beach']|uniref:creatininase family protein n=1 Tax=Acaryochloris sp. 'Moss Beach' TaxID=2740837 RepID=UPI0037BE2CB1